MLLILSHLIFSSFSYKSDGVEEGKVYFAIIWKDEDEGRNCFGSTYINSCQIIDPLAAKMLPENCFRHTHVILLIYPSNKNKGRVGKGNKHLLS